MTFKSILKQLKLFDYILIGFTLVLSFLPAIFTYTHLTTDTNEAKQLPMSASMVRWSTNLNYQRTHPIKKRPTIPMKGNTISLKLMANAFVSRKTIAQTKLPL